MTVEDITTFLNKIKNDQRTTDVQCADCGRAIKPGDTYFFCIWTNKNCVLALYDKMV